MKKYFTRSLLVLTVVLCLVATRFTALAQGTTTFTYQGQLHDSATNANGNYAMIFKLYNAASGGSQVGGAITNLVTLANGLFTVNLDFGAGAFDGSSRWLEIAVGNTNGGNFVTSSETLSPRVAVLPVPYALYAGVAGSAATLSSGSWGANVGNYQSYSNVFGIYANNNLVLGLSTNGVLVNGNLQANGLGLNGDIDLGTNLIQFHSVSGGASLAFDGQNGVYVGGDLDVQNSLKFMNNGGNFQSDGQGGIQTLGNLSVSNLTFFGSSLQFPGQSGATLTVTNGNFVFDHNVVIGALGTISLPAASGSRTIGADNQGVNVDGIHISSSTGINMPNGAGVIQLVGNGSGLSIGSDVTCFNVHANQVYAGGVLLTSDRNTKENFHPVDSQSVLAKVAALPVMQWNYKTDEQGLQHIGPMAQDFSTAFRLNGSDDKHISVVDEGGVALAAIQGLNSKLEEKDKQIETLEKRLADLEALVKPSASK